MSWLLGVVATLGCALPASASVTIENGLTHERASAAGEVYSDEVVIGNGSDRASMIKLYQTDYQFEAGGSAHYDPVGSVARSNGGWVSVGASSIVEVAPHGRAVVPFTVTVPPDPDLAGTYWSVLMVEEIEATRLTPETRPEGSLGVRKVLRYAIQLVTQVGDADLEDFLVESIRLEPRDRNHLGRLHATLRNTGTTLFRADLRVQLFDDLGLEIGTFVAGRRRLYPDTSATYTADLSAVPRAHYKMIVAVRMGSGNVYASELALPTDRGDD